MNHRGFAAPAKCGKSPPGRDKLPGGPWPAPREKPSERLTGGGTHAEVRDAPVAADAVKLIQDRRLPV